MSMGDTIRKNTLWILAGDVSGRIIMFAVGIVLARILVPEDFGLLVTINIFTGVVGLFAAGGMGEALVQAKTVKDDDFRVVFTIQLLICLLIYLIFYYIAPAFAVWFKNSQYIDLLRVSALSFLMRPFANVPRSQLKRAMRFKAVASIRLSSMILGSFISILMALKGMGVWSLVTGGLAGSLASMLLLLVVTCWIPAIRYDITTAKRLGAYGIKVSTNEIITYLRNQTANLIISRQLGPSMTGLYNKADSLSIMPIQITGRSTYQTVFRALSGIQDEVSKSRYIYFRTITLLSVYTLPVSIGMIWVAEPLIVTLYGTKWIDSALPLQILSLASLFRCISNPSGAVIAAQNRLGYEIRIQVETWIVLTLGCLAGLRWGIPGVAAGILPCYVYLALRMSWLANTCVRAGFIDLVRSLVPALLLNSILTAALLVTYVAMPADLQSTHPPLYVLTMTSVGGLVYILSFMYLPIPALSSEALRWKRLLRLAG
jgi:O-antigen/teichoic acid export membrane protein